MTRKTKALSGAAQDAYFRRVLKTYPGLGEDARDRLVRQLRREIAQVRVRPGARAEAEAAKTQAHASASTPVVDGAQPPAQAPTAEPVAAPAAPAPAFDPFAPNVIVVLRTSGRAAALAALAAIADADNLRLLAREQRLSIGDDVRTTAEIGAAIVAAAERRIANRRAAAGA